jgi:hypothetical protein
MRSLPPSAAYSAGGMHSSIDESEKREEQRMIIRFHMTVSIRMNLRALVGGYAKKSLKN